MADDLPPEYKQANYVPIEKSCGATAAEKYLAYLCDKTFLSLWSYPGLYRDQGRHAQKGDGKEICDLLVVFGEHVIIFSDKHCQIQNSGDGSLDWLRWFRKAIQKSAEQAWGAERWLRQYPDRVFLDRACTKPLPIDLPRKEKAKYHLVVVAHGVSSRVRSCFPGSSGSLMIDTDLKGFENHTFPFYVGDLAPTNTFVHILDDESLETLMSARDTISDFVAYLSKREKLLRGSRAILATGEEQLLAVYLTNFDKKTNEHDFIFPIKPGQPVTNIYFAEGHWETFQKSPERIAQVNEDEVSYMWDRLISKFNHYALRGEQYFVTSGGFKDAEAILRFMAREPRWKRRYLAKQILEMLQSTPATHHRRLKVLFPTDPGDPHYVFLLLPKTHSKSDEEYRTVRWRFLGDCCAVAKLEFPDAKDIIGIATEPGINLPNRSEDALYFNARNWTAEMEAHAKTTQKKLKILIKPRMLHEQMQEFPDVHDPDMKIKNPRNKPCPCGSGKKYKKCCLNR